MTRHASRIIGVLLCAGLAWATPLQADPLLQANATPGAMSPNDIGSEEIVTVRIHAREFIPPTVQLHAGQKIRLVLKNEDTELHAFVPGDLFSGVNLNVGGNGAPEFNERGFRKVIIPGQGTAELRFVLRQTGQYPYICDMPGHEMNGTIVVR